MLTKKQKELFEFLSDFILKNDISPSFEEMKKAVKKERYLSKEDAKLINQFISKIRKELKESED